MNIEYTVGNNKKSQLKKHDQITLVHKTWYCSSPYYAMQSLTGKTLGSVGTEQNTSFHFKTSYEEGIASCYLSFASMLRLYLVHLFLHQVVFNCRFCELHRKEYR